MNNTNMQNADVRMTYNAPELRVHGDIAQLTLANSTTGRRDNAISGNVNKS